MIKVNNLTVETTTTMPKYTTQTSINSTLTAKNKTSSTIRVDTSTQARVEHTTTLPTSTIAVSSQLPLFTPTKSKFSAYVKCIHINID